MPAVKTKHFTGGAGINVPDARSEDLATMLRACIDDITDIRAKYALLLAKLDADAGVTDTNYAATLVLATQSFTKG
ncbi:MAG: hypothetical protein M3P47_05975 [Pseudomonadota bacterium]|nr:hypothetical protein [Pseudomonadota bacterium]